MRPSTATLFAPRSTRPHPGGPQLPSLQRHIARLNRCWAFDPRQLQYRLALFVPCPVPASSHSLEVERLASRGPFHGRCVNFTAFLRPASGRF